ncbi:DHA2 family efflux MFS transporter permease subunit [Pontibacillus yanchengensis]|uniref:Multidrug MFS transporter n=1 Tax=Pontibacillus yanchengensis Y32 TaxID=1385514 RepID=A0A0A2TN57_9BACI|nr:DHA2 family efflux MFS transporter permease subunit [Pontibacillus yanchengensis]KGP70785.1 multidrug MFS transporter [Pontibacillus yanchengensis Y32]
MSDKDIQPGQSFNKKPIVAVLIIGAFVAILNQTLLATALPHIMNDLDISANTAQWLTTVFMLVNGIMIPITAFLIETFTTRRLFLSAIGLFTIGTIIASVAPDFASLMVGRVIQASGAGIMMPLMQTVFLTIFPVEKRGQVMGLVGLVIAFAPAIGPTLSGWLIGFLPWRSLFFVVLPIAVIDLIIAYFVLKNVTERRYPKLDITSIILSSFGFGGLLYGFSVAGTDGWLSANALISLIVGAITLTIFILRQLKLDQPILEFRVFKYPVFTFTTIVAMVVFISMISAETILPIYLQEMLGYTALESGLVLLPGAIAMGIMSPITGRIFDKVGAKWLALTGMSIITVTTFFFTSLEPNTTLAYVTVVYAIRMFGVSMVMMPVTTAGLNQLNLKLIPHGTAMGNTMRQVAGSIGTAILVTVMTNSATPNTSPTRIEGMIHGVNVAFMVATGLGFIGVILAMFIKNTNPNRKKQNTATEAVEA